MIKKVKSNRGIERLSQRGSAGTYPVNNNDPRSTVDEDEPDDIDPDSWVDDYINDNKE
jgi:hypothetical protein